MRFNLPGPLRGWREFFGEVGIIVLGVLIALGAQQLVEGIHKRNDVPQLVAAPRAELADDRARWEHMRASDPCTLQRLDAIERWLETTPAKAKLSHSFRLFLLDIPLSARAR